MKPRSPTPPRWAERLLGWFCKPELLEMVLGDLYEQFDTTAEEQPRRARRQFAWQVLRLFRPPIIRRRLFSTTTHSLMLWTNYLKVAWRSIRKQRGYAFINLSGLTLGLLCFLFLFSYVRHQQRYDNFHDQGPQIVQAYMDARFDGEQQISAVTPTALLPTLQRESALVKMGARLYRPGTYFPQLVRQGETMFEETEIYYVDSAFLQMFTFPLLQGDAATALSQPKTVVLTESAALKYFGTTAVLGETITLRGQEFSITGLTADPPANTSFNFLMLASFSSLPQSQSEQWGGANYHTYLLLEPGADIQPIFDGVNAQIAEEFREYLGDEGSLTYAYVPLADVHLNAPFDHDLKPQGNQTALWILLSIGLLVLVIACINYMNLATARSIYRAREVGMRKVMGAARSHVFRQFMSEALLFTLIAVLGSVGLMFALWPQFEVLAGETITQPLTQDQAFFAYLGGLVVLVALLAGSYPSLVLSHYRPLQVLKGAFLRAPAGQSLRKGLVVLQFAISALLIFGTTTMLQQLHYLNDVSVGYTRDQVVTVPITRGITSRWDTFKAELSALSGVQAVGALTNSPHRIMGGYSIWVEGMPVEDHMPITAAAADDGMVKTLDMELVAGRSISPEEVERARDYDEETGRASAILLNESAVAKLGQTPEDILGKQARINGRNGPVVGVIKDFHFRSLHEEIGPLALFAEPDQMHYALLRVSDQQMTEVLAQVKSVWQGFEPDRLFSYDFLDASYAAMYEAEQRQGQIVAVFAGVAIFIACLGLLGLASLAAIQRRKEVAIRKVVGAGSGQLVVLLSRQFFLLIGLGLLIALPLGYYLADGWLAGFAYRIHPGIGLALIAVGSVLGLGLLTVAWEAWRAARSNPIKSLRAE